MQKEKIELTQWRELYEAASEFKKLKCWEWMTDTDLFVVENPETGEIGYCCVLGNLGEVFALVVNLGDQGLAGYRRMQSGEFEDGSSLYLVQKCLMASYENKGYLQDDDLKRITDLGLAFKGRKAWPCFRSLEPGYLPWSISDQEARFLTVALRQTSDVAIRFRTDPTLFGREGENKCLLRKKCSAAEDGSWEDEYVPFPEPVRERHTGLFDMGRAEKIKKRLKETACKWEVDIFESPLAVAGSTRPFFPMSLIAAEAESGFIYGNEFEEPWDFNERIPAFFMDTIEQAGYIPGGVSMKKSISTFLSPLLSILGVKLVCTGHLPACSHFLRGLRESMLAKHR